MKRIILTESQFTYLIESVSLNDIYNKYYSNIDEDIFYRIIQSDPTYNELKPQKMGKYGKWLLNLYNSNNLKLEDLYKAKEYLTIFVKYYNVIEDRDINHYKSLVDLYNVVKTYMDNNNISTSHNDEIRNIKEGAEKVYEDNDWMIIIPHTKEASCYYGKGTQWCTAADSSYNYFDNYNDQGNLYINIDKRTNEKYQFHFETDSFMDETDSPIDFPIVENIPITNGAIKWYINNVEDGKKIQQVKNIILENESGVLYLMKYMNDELWNLYVDDEFIVGDIVHNENNDGYEYYGYELEKYGYTSLINANKKEVLICYDKEDGNYQLVGSNYETINDVCGDDYYSIIETIDSHGTYELLAIPSCIRLYRKTNANYLSAKEIGYDVVAIPTNNGLYDLVQTNSGEVIEDVRPEEGDYFDIDDDDQYPRIYAIDMDGNQIEINVEDFSINYLW